VGGKCPVSGRGGDEAIESKMAKKMRTRSGGAACARDAEKITSQTSRIHVSTVIRSLFRLHSIRRILPASDGYSPSRVCSSTAAE